MSSVYDVKEAGVYAVFREIGGEYEQMSVWMILSHALSFLKDVRHVNPHGRYKLLSIMDA